MSVEDFRFLRSYSKCIAQAVASCGPDDCRAIVEFGLSRVPTDLLLVPEVEAALAATLDKKLGCDDLKALLEYQGERFHSMVLDAQESGDDQAEEHFSDLQCVCWALACVVGRATFTPADVDRFLYYITTVMQGDAKAALQEFLECGPT